jgi:hypothetical protein
LLASYPKADEAQKARDRQNVIPIDASPLLWKVVPGDLAGFAYGKPWRAGLSGIAGRLGLSPVVSADFVSLFDPPKHPDRRTGMTSRIIGSNYGRAALKSPP